MALQVRRAGAAEYGRWVKALVCGDPGSGKTRTASTWPAPLFCSAEGGMMSVADRGVPFIDVTTSAQLVELRSVLEQKEEIRTKLIGTEVQTVIVDTIDEVARILVKERLEAERKQTMAIQDWGWLGDQLRGFVRGFRNLDMHVIFNCHVKSAEDSENGRMFIKPAIQGAMGDEIAGYVDLAVLLTARPMTRVKDGNAEKEIVRVMQTFPDANHPWIKDRSGRLPMEFPINFEDDFARAHELIYAGIDTAVAPTPSPTSSVAAPPAPPQAPTKKAAPAAAPPKPPAKPPAAPPEAEPADTAAEAPPEQPEPEAATDEAATDAATEAEVPVQPDLTPQPEDPEPQQEPQPEPEAPVEPEPEAEPEAEPDATSVPADGTEPPEVAADEAADGERPAWQVCEECNGDIESKDQSDLSFIRYRMRLCRKDFAAKKKS